MAKVGSAIVCDYMEMSALAIACDCLRQFVIVIIIFISFVVSRYLLILFCFVINLKFTVNCITRFFS